MERNNLIENSRYAEEIEALRSKTLKWRKDNPSNYDPMKNGRPHFGNMEMDWELRYEICTNARHWY
jgi:hypothetical protein